MKAYRSHQEFIEDLMIWGNTAVNETSNDWNSYQAFLKLWIHMEKGVENNVFFPFLYVVLSAEICKEEAMLLAAALYCEILEENSHRLFTVHFWKHFLQEENVFSGTELFYQASSLLFERNLEEALSLKIKPQIFLFLSKGILLERNISGMYWYYRKEAILPFLGNNIRKYMQIKVCMEQIYGKKLFYLYGEKGSGRKLNYAYLAASMKKNLAVVQYDSLYSKEQLLEILVECVLHHGMLAIELPEMSKVEKKEISVLLEWMKEEENIFILGDWEYFPYHRQEDRQYLSFGIDVQFVLNDKELFWKLTEDYQWEEEKIRIDFLKRYLFLPGKVRSILELANAYALSEGKSNISEQNLKRAILHSGRHSLQKYAKKIDAFYSMEDLILPTFQKEKIYHILNRVKNKKQVYEEWGFSEKSAYGNGVSMIFAGPPGTGKTMAAQAVAAELGMELYRVELPAIVDKYIGEMEKKLNRIFEEAKKSIAILFFDEADVLFSKRTEIKESNDKYSNMEIAFLLQKIEEYEGVSILATNYLQNFDEAFRRRISDIIDFPMPDADAREKMWRTMIPEQLPVSEDIDYIFLAKQFQITGSVIKNALIYASFLAAEAPEQALNMEKILQGITHELEKSGRKLNREDYGEYYMKYKSIDNN